MKHTILKFLVLLLFSVQALAEPTPLTGIDDPGLRSAFEDYFQGRDTTPSDGVFVQCASLLSETGQAHLAWILRQGNADKWTEKTVNDALDNLFASDVFTSIHRYCH